MVLLLVGPEQWGTVDPSTGDTLAHWAARNDCLPLDFDQWDLTDRNGRTVRDVVMEQWRSRHRRSEDRERRRNR